VDEVYSLYRDQLNDDEEDAVAIVLSILEDQSRENVLQLIDEMSDDEIMQMLGVYLVEMLKMKWCRMESYRHIGRCCLRPGIIDG